jgi:hypothetical protein
MTAACLPSRPPVGWGVPLLLLVWACSTPALAQDRTGYILGEPRGLEMEVHIIGEVQKPGEYRVRDQATVLELLSKAGGPTAFSRLSHVTVRRVLLAPGASASPTGLAPSVEILAVDLERALRDKDAPPPLTLRPGDVVVVPKNAWHKWKDVSAIVRDVSVVASLYFLYLRATRD